MDAAFLVPLLAMMTLLAGCAWALWSKEAVQSRMDDPNARKSTMAADKSSTGTPADV
ncbi:hypothetical protein [Pontivivens insulae]|uniref:Uncharacterized protein n=1 Tax=Pontivivens insulae TaxID=1639689 RepID=A0A2R8AFM5_9RHOB|nr:hypothetical protein [Pontivivens insulae]RED12274.1 hypothetical protein DFR53_2992 [Pontivivens insulae]SPF31031.1 hypothetical protein POI8812_03381 [Pontivivens insulae]